MADAGAPTRRRARKARSRSPRWARRVALVVVTAAVVLWLVPLPSSWIDAIYATRVYPRWQRAITPLADRVPVALFDVWLVAILAVGALVLLRAWRREARWAARLIHVTSAIVVLASAVYLWFMVSWGLNYRRARLETRIDFARERVNPGRLDDLAARTVAGLNALHPRAWAEPWPEWRAVPRTLASRVDAVAVSLALPPGMAPGAPHRTLLQPYFRWASIEGMTNPFLLEVLVNDDLLPMERPAMVAHEWGHLAGLAHEAEASYFGWRLCHASGVQAQYSAWLFISGTVFSAIPAPRRAALLARLEPGPRQDLRAIAARHARAVPAVRDAAWVAYDRYLKSNRVASGVDSYDEVLVLILGTSALF